MSKKMMQGLCMVLYLQCKKRGETYLRVLRSGYIRMPPYSASMSACSFS